MARGQYIPGKYGREVAYTSPRTLVQKLAQEFPFTLDVCAIPQNAQVQRYFTPDMDGLAQSWSGHTCWMNPPWGREIERWIDKAIHETRDGRATVIALVPARTSSPWWHKAAQHADECRIFLHKMYFNNTETGAKYIPFLGTCVFIFNGRSSCRFTLVRQ